MDIGDAKVAVLLATDLFDEYFRALRRSGAAPPELDETKFEVASDSSTYYTRLYARGTVVLDVPGGDSIETELETQVRMSIVLVSRPGQAPVVGLQYDGVDVDPDPPLTREYVDWLFTNPPVSDLVASVELDLVAPVIAALSDHLYPDEDPPPPDQWDVDIQLATRHGDFWDSIAVYVAEPNTLQNLGDDESLLPELREVGIIHARELMDTVFANTASQQVGMEMDGAEITHLELEMLDDAVHIEGKAERDGAEVTFAGPLRVQLLMGTNIFDVDAFEVEVNLPWFTFFLGPLGGFVTMGLGPLIGEFVLLGEGTSTEEVLPQIRAIPGMVRGGIADVLATELAALVEGLQVNGALGNLNADSTTWDSKVEDGAIAVFAQVFLNPLTARITRGYYSRSLRRLTRLRLAGGRWFSSAELARLVMADVISTPGAHSVQGPTRMYMRSNPDTRTDNNLL